MVEGWDLKFLLEKTQEAIAFAKKNQMPIMFVTEDTTRAYPSDLREIYGAAIDAGADEICIADTVGHATPSGARAVTLAVKNLLIEKKSTHVLLNWHGHSDRGLAVINSLEAAKAGADILHASGIGIGERSGNTPMDQLLVNLKLLNRWDHPLQGLAHYVELVSQSVDMPISKNYPVFGEDAFRTATGVHAAAIIKAIKLGRSDLADVIYSGVPAHLFGLKQEIEIGRMSGKSNVIFWLSSHHLPTDDTLVNQILTCAHESRTVLSEQTLMKIVQDWQNTLT
jgi:2-isopropylmalate synthase